jgi:hypothetical protein
MMMAIALFAAAWAADGEEISTSRGKKEGIVVLWPRSVPSNADPAMLELSRRLQERLAATATAVVGERLVDVRPAPERVCPQGGCKAASVGLMLGQRGGGCALVAVVSGPGVAPAQLLPLVGQVELFSPSGTFRQPPEQLVNVQEFVPCDQVLGELDLLGVDSALRRLTAPQ